MNFRIKRSIHSTLTIIITLTLVLTAGLSHMAKAATFDEVMVRFDRMNVSEPTTGTICAKPATTETEASVDVTFPTGYSLGLAATFTVNTTDTAWPSGASAWVGINTATNVNSQVVTFPSGDLSVGTLYCFNWTNSAAVSVTSSPSASNSGSITTKTGASADIDTGNYSTASISGDQIVVSATVLQTFSFALSANTDNLGNLSTSSITTSSTPRTATINTNAKSGWIVWAKDSNTGLSSTMASHTIASTTPGSNSTLSTNSEGYNTGLTSSQVGGTGTITIAAAFVGTALGQGGGLDSSLRTLATSDGTADTAVLTIKNNATISPVTPAASDYTDTITVIAAGLF